MTTFLGQFRKEPALTPVRLIATSNVSGTYSNGQSGVGATLLGAASTLTIDSVACVNGDRVLLSGQTNTYENGIYIVSGIGSAFLLTRSDDFQTAQQMEPGYYAVASAGSVMAGTVMCVVEPQVGAVGTDAISFANSSNTPTTVTLANNGLRVLDTNASHYLQITPGSDLTANRIFTLVTGDAARTLTMTGDATVNQDVSTAGSPAFAAVTVANTGLHILDTNASHDLIIAPGSDLTADRTLTVTTGDSARTLTLSGNATLDQDVSTTGSPAFAGVTVANTGLHVLDTNASHDLIIAPGSDLTADRTLTVTTGDADRTLDISAASVTVSAYGATLVDDTTNLLALTTLGLKRGDSDTWGGGGTSFAFTCAGIVATDVVLVSLIAAANNVAVTKCVAGAGTITVDFTADPGAGTIVNFLGIPTV